jgi:hypothetical protein
MPKASPRIFAPVFRVYGLYHGNIFPSVYALERDGLELVYTTVLHQTEQRSRDLGVNLLNPETIICNCGGEIVYFPVFDKIISL